MTGTRAKTLHEAMAHHSIHRTGSGCWEWLDAKTKDGYGVLRFQNRRYYAHCVAYELTYGPVPQGHETDHRCLNTSCVNPEHLRAVTHKQNSEHRRGAYSNSLTGIRGVTYDQKRGQYRARVKDNYREIHVGRFDTLDEAAAAVEAKRRELFTHNDCDRGAA